MKQKDFAKLLMAFGVGVAYSQKSRKKGSRSFSPKVKKYLGLPDVELRSSDDFTGTRVAARATTSERQLWNLASTNTYGAQRDMILIALREAYQNSMDAIDLALEQGLIEKGQFNVIWDQRETPNGPEVDLILQDNGIGMSAEDIRDRFLSLGAKGGKTQTSRGGFGYAKAAILMLAQNFEFEIRTRNLLYTSSAFRPQAGEEFYVEDFRMENGVPVPLEYFAGTSLRLKNINLKYINNRTNLVLTPRLQTASYASSMDQRDIDKEWKRIAEFLYLNKFDYKKYGIAFFVHTADVFSLYYKSFGDMTLQSFAEHLLLPLDFETTLYRENKIWLFDKGKGMGLQIGRTDRDIVEAEKPYYFAMGTYALPVGYGADYVDSSIKTKRSLYVVVTIQGQVQFIIERGVDKDDASFPLIYLDLYPKVKAIEDDYPLDLARLRLNSRSDEALRKLINAIKRSTEQVRDLFDAEFYQTSYFNMVTQDWTSLSMGEGFETTREDDKYKEVGTPIRLTYHSVNAIEMGSYRARLVEEYNRELRWTPISVWEIIDKADTHPQWSSSPQQGRANIMKLKGTVLSPFSFLLTENLSSASYTIFRDFFKTIYLLLLDEDELNPHDFKTQGKFKLTGQVLGRLAKFKKQFGLSASMSEEKAKRFFAVFCPDPMINFNTKVQGFDNPAIYGMYLFLLYTNIGSPDEEDALGRFAYSYALIRRYWFDANNFDESAYFQNAKVQKYLLSEVPSVKIVGDQAIEVFTNPLFGSMFMRCDYGGDYSLMETPYSFVAFCFWAKSLQLVIETVQKDPHSFKDLWTYFDKEYASRSVYVGTVFDDPVVKRRGRLKQKSGIAMAMNRTTGNDYYLLINPILYWNIRKQTNDASKIAILIFRTLVHELTHCGVHYHGEDFTVAEARIFKDLVLAGIPFEMAELLIYIDPTVKAPRGSKKSVIQRQLNYLQQKGGSRGSCSR
jgi:hypothetical protein